MHSTKLKAEGTAHEHCTPADKVIPVRVQVNDSEAAIHV